MTPIESQALAEVMFWYGLFALVFVAGCWVLHRVYDCIDQTAEEQAERVRQEAERNANSG